MKRRGDKHGLLWELVDRIQSTPDMRKTETTNVPKPNRDDWELKNSFRL